nr:lumican-like isoform X2 [Leptinotarsa decemlineata]
MKLSVALAWLLFLPLISSTGMKCEYGERGSLTAICTNATPSFFKTTNYRFDYLDETLICLNCTLDTLEAGTFDIAGNEIQTLIIKNSSINSIRPKAFIGMIHMERLMLSDNPIETLYPGAFIGIRKVKYLEMENAVHRLEPHVFRELFMLEILILRRNELTELKAGTFEGLHNLKILDLGYNLLKTVNNTFDTLVNLLVLRLNNNMIHTIHGDDFNNLKALLVLNLNENHLSNFSMNIGSDNHLRTLNMAANNLSSDSFLPETFKNLNYVEDLDLSDNVFKNISPTFLHGLFRLTTLNLCRNELTTINTGSFTGLPYLRTLNFSNNQLVSLKLTGRLQLHSLSKLDLSRNNINSFDYINLITKAPRLKYIDLVGNNLSCELSTELETLMNEDNIDFMIISNGGAQLDCPKVTKSYEQLMKNFTEELTRPIVNDTVLVWMFVLITLVILLVGVLFYIQFFILLRMNSGSCKNIRIMRNLRSRTENIQ